jgi:hypothetical protein
MRKIFLWLIFFSIGKSSLAQNDKLVKDSFIIKAIPTYDVNGNVYYFEKKLDHYPTSEDTILFNKEQDIAIQPMIDSVEREVEKEKRRIEEMNRNYKASQKQFAPLNPREGKHLFSLQWISWTKFGAVIIKKIVKGQYSIKGGQIDDDGNYVNIDGILIPVSKGEMKFKGEIVTKVSGNNKGEPCVKKGEYTFLCSPGRKYWRLQEMYNCEEGYLVDYVDVFF